MRIKTAMLAAVLTCSGTAAFAGDAMFTPDEYGAVSSAAIAQFKADMPDVYEMFWGVYLTRNTQGGEDIGVQAKIYVKHNPTDANAMMHAKYNCQKQNVAIVCRPG